MMTKQVPTSLRLKPRLAGEIDSRGARSMVIHRDLERLYTLYRHALANMNLSAKEACLIADALNGILFEPATAQLLWANIAEAISVDGLDTKWGVDGKALVERLRTADHLTCFAIIDAAERFWQAVGRGVEQDTIDLVRTYFLSA
jgi:hypothetical protein